MSTVLLRGLARDSRHWGSFPAKLAAALDEEVAALDLPGNGELHTEKSPSSVDAMVEAYRDMLRARRTPPPYHVFALSLGAMVAIAWATRYPQECRCLVLVNTSA
ncbi:MAG: alpha/beta hydrolase, partial [Rhizobacter sp.]|nr:alpha/beta hydrolase [Rhizobacter sp.]